MPSGAGARRGTGLSRTCAAGEAPAEATARSQLSLSRGLGSEAEGGLGSAGWGHPRPGRFPAAVGQSRAAASSSGTRCVLCSQVGRMLTASAPGRSGCSPTAQAGCTPSGPPLRTPRLGRPLFTKAAASSPQQAGHSLPHCPPGWLDPPPPHPNPSSQASEEPPLEGDPPQMELQTRARAADRCPQDRARTGTRPGAHHVRLQ